MNMNTLINMVIRVVLRRGVNSGINKMMSTGRKLSAGRKAKKANAKDTPE